jgi:hypothetical protein
VLPFSPSRYRTDILRPRHAAAHQAAHVGDVDMSYGPQLRLLRAMAEDFPDLSKMVPCQQPVGQGVVENFRCNDANQSTFEGGSQRPTLGLHPHTEISRQTQLPAVTYRLHQIDVLGGLL